MVRSPAIQRYNRYRKENELEPGKWNTPITGGIGVSGEHSLGVHGGNVRAVTGRILPKME
jgi:hypothetical protein